MPTRYCTEGKHEVWVGPQGHGGERNCPTHPGCELRSLPKKQSTREAIKSTVLYQRGLAAFNRAVCEEPCFFSDQTEEEIPRRGGHTCRNPLEAHHLVPKDFIFSNYGDLPLAELVAILFDPRIGAPLCRTAHDLVEYSSAADARIFWEELSFRAIEACEEIDAKYGDRPLPSGGKRQSMLERLRVECPERESAAT